MFYITLTVTIAMAVAITVTVRYKRRKSECQLNCGSGKPGLHPSQEYLTRSPTKKARL